MSLFSEFRDFAIKGNMIDIAVGIIMGAAFGGVVTSLVGDIIMPPIGVAMGGVDFSSIGPALPGHTADGKPLIWAIGKFINTLINFIIVAAAVFALVKAVNMAKKMAMKEPPAADAPPPPRQEVLLQEIRDALVKT
jgi:large conductance mechanosensitive channel